MRGLVLGAIAGAAGTLALDMVSYADMAVRGRSSSDLPAEVVRRLAIKAGVGALSVPSDQADEKLKNRRNALGALSGYEIGLLIGALYGLASERSPGDRGLLARALILGAAAMAASDVPATMLDATDPKEWSPASWLSDIVPHVAYGMVTAAAFAAIARPRA